MTSHLIIGNSEDYHAVAVKWALGKQGESAMIWDGISAESSGHVSMEPGALPIGICLGGVEHQSFSSVWYRRVVKYRDVERVADYTRDFIELELRQAHGCLSTTVNAIAKFVVGGEGMAKASSKAYQLDLAAIMGFNIPKTLITNDYDKACRFIDDNHPVVIKPFIPHFWHEPNSQKYRIASTNIVADTTGMSRESANACPCIFQKFIQKKYELRVTVIGEQVFSARIRKSGGGSFVDWRYHIQSDDAIIERVDLSDEMEKRIISYVAALDLKYGCIDLVVDDDNTIFFLEINPSGQFLFVEQMIPEFALLNTFSSMLRAQSKSFNADRSDAISTSAFEQTDDFQAMMANRGKIVTSVPIYSRVSN